MQTPGSAELVPVPALKECNTIMALSQTGTPVFCFWQPAVNAAGAIKPDTPKSGRIVLSMLLMPFLLEQGVPAFTLKA